MKIYPILNNLGKGKYVFIFILNERAVINAPAMPRQELGFLAGTLDGIRD